MQIIYAATEIAAWTAFTLIRAQRYTDLIIVLDVQGIAKELRIG